MQGDLGGCIVSHSGRSARGWAAGVELCGVVAYSSNRPKAAAAAAKSTTLAASPQSNKNREKARMNPFTSVPRAIVTAFVLAIIVMVAVPDRGFNELSLARWLHILSGIMWIGLLYYFNVVQVPALNAASADQGGPGGAGISKYVAPRALFWFRWGAVATWLTGAWFLLRNGNFVDVFTFGLRHDAFSSYHVILGIGAWLGTIMLFNVWAFIWPAQKKILGIVAATDAQKASARKVGLYASRMNFILSVPMVLCMASAGHTSAFTLPF
jgi:hypothetical protein